MTKTIGAVRFKKIDTTIPQNIAEANEMLGTLGIAEGKVISLTARRQKEIDAVMEKYAAYILEAEKSRDVAFTKLFTFAQPRRASLIEKVKTLFWSNGKISWRFTTPKVTYDKDSEKVIIKFLRKNKMTKYLRVTTTLNKEAMLEDRPIVAGVTYTRHEEFVAKPKYLVGDTEVSSTVTKVI
jgi:phage host-nuclease inhibitor protein Gam